MSESILLEMGVKFVVLLNKDKNWYIITTKYGENELQST